MDGVVIEIISTSGFVNASPADEVHAKLTVFFVCKQTPNAILKLVRAAVTGFLILKLIIHDLIELLNPALITN